MMWTVVVAILSQATSNAGVTQAPVAPSSVSFSDGARRFTLYPSATLVAEARAAAHEDLTLAIRTADPSAELIVSRPTMRLWRVRDAARVSAEVKGLRPVFHDVPSGAGRLRVPLALVCGAERLERSWQEVLARSGANGCLPDFWYPPVLR